MYNRAFKFRATIHPLNRDDNHSLQAITTNYFMDKTYNPQAIESSWYQHWEDKGYFSAEGDGDPYCIVIPPPNVTGSLHMGHAFQDTIMDSLVRYHRMKGDKTLLAARY